MDPLTRSERKQQRNSCEIFSNKKMLSPFDVHHGFVIPCTSLQKRFYKFCNLFLSLSRSLSPSPLLSLSLSSPISTQTTIPNSFGIQSSFFLYSRITLRPTRYSQGTVETYLGFHPTKIISPFTFSLCVSVPAMTGEEKGYYNDMES